MSWLLVVGSGDRIALGESLVMGADAGADVFLDGDVAAREAVLDRVGDGVWMLKDAGESGRVMVDGAVVDAVEVRDGARISVAGVEFVVGGREEGLGADFGSDHHSGDGVEALGRLRRELAKVIVGQAEVVDQVVIALLCRGHALLVGVPGLAKTLLVSSLAKALDLGFKRVQFTPDLMPADITGTDVLEEDAETGRRAFRFVPGPLFTNLLLADEINRTPPKTQAALLEAMQERQVTVGEESRKLPEPFFVLATQNPIEQEGTFPLPEAQLDRFLLNVLVDYPDEAEEQEVVRRATWGEREEIGVVMRGEELVALQEAVVEVPVGDHVIAYATGLARLSRPKGENVPEFVRELVAWGAGPRAAISLVMAAKAAAFLRGGTHVTTQDVAGVAAPVLRHRIVPTFAAEASGVGSDAVVEMLLREMAPSSELVELTV